MGRLARAFFVGAAVISACGTPTRDAASTPPDTAVADCAPTTFELVDAAQVEIVGDMTKEHQEIAAWALDRFDQASLDLPSRIQVGFDPDRSMCHGATGVCHPQRVPPEALVCEPDDGFKAQQLAQRVTLLHELGHL